MAYDIGRLLILGEGEAEPAGRPWVRLLPYTTRGRENYYPWWKSTTVASVEALPDDCTGLTVVDFGCGATAILALAAARLGAARVIAIDRQAALIDEARRQVAANGLSGVIECVVGDEGAVPDCDYLVANVGDAALVGAVSIHAPHGHGTDAPGELLKW